MKLLQIALIALFALSTTSADAAKPKKRNKKGKDKTEVVVKKDTVAKGSIEAVIKPGAKHSDGLFNVVEQKGKYYFKLPTKDLGRDYLLVTRISKAPAGLRAGMTGYAGDDVSEEMIRFSLAPDSTKVFLSSIVTYEMPRDTTGDMYDNVQKSNYQPLIQSFKVEGKNKAKDTLLIDVTDFLLSDNELTSFGAWDRKSLSVSQFQKDRSYIESVKSFPINTEIKTVKTYKHTPTQRYYDGSPLPSRTVSFELNTSIVALPEIPMQPRYADSRVGYFSEWYTDFDKNPQGVKDMQLITRWRLEPKPEDMEAYKRGELVEPAEPIIYYIDPTTPEKWVAPLIQGVNDWEEVFRAAGFKNAIRAERAPVGDSTWSIDDARHSAIVYKPSTIPNASGPNIHDPRTGQILESHINWYHNVMLLLRNWYMIQAAPNNPEAQQMTFPDELMAQLIRFVSSHEVGHTLGLRHNFGSTSTTPVDSLRSKTYLEKYGHTPSIMDYSRFNYVVQPEDGIDPELQFPRIGDYDRWAIEWGYRRFPEFKTPDEEATKLNEWIIEAQKDPRLWFGHEMNPDDPRSQSEDLGDNQMVANALGIKNLERVVDGLPEWTKVENEGYNNLEEMYNEVLTQYGRYVGHVAKWIGGIFENPRTIEQGADVYEFVSKAKQQEAMRWLDKYFFKTQNWLMNDYIFQRTGMTKIDVANRIYAFNLSKILNNRVISNLLTAEAEMGSKAYTVENYFSDLNRYIFNSNPSAMDRIKQKNYVAMLIRMVPEEEHYNYRTVSDATAMVVAELRSIQSRLSYASSNDKVTAAHYKYLVEMIKNKLNKN